ncbi:MAG: replicative DNA helicase [Breznakibacter sp.]|nr:replicative DNA helicase [Breznakibacter sp.]
MADFKGYKKREQAPVDGNLIGKVPPQAIETEEIVLGALLLEKEPFMTVSEFLKPECFYVESNRKIYTALLNLHALDAPVDLMSVCNELSRLKWLEDVGGYVHIAQLTSKVASAAHIEFHARIIWQKYIQREIIRISTVIQTKSFDEASDVNDLLNEAESSFFMLSQGTIKNEVTQIAPVIKEALEMLQRNMARKDGLTGVPSGFTALDRMTSGWQNSDMIVIAARPAMGKTAFILSMTRNMAVAHNSGVAIFSLEMSNVQLVNRLIVSETEIDADKIKRGRLMPQEWVQLEQRVQNLINAPIYIDDTAGLSILELRTKCRRLMNTHKNNPDKQVKMILIDYLQLMTASGMNPGSREQEVSLISRSLKGLAKELNVPIVALSQLNRGVEGRSGKDKRPQLNDLRESGAIEQDADMVLFIHRPEYYQILQDEEGNSLVGIAEIIIAKHRNGAVGDVRLRFRSELARFEDVEIADFGGIGNASNMTFSSKMNSVPPIQSNNSSFGGPVTGTGLSPFPEVGGNDVPF